MADAVAAQCARRDPSQAVLELLIRVYPWKLLLLLSAIRSRICSAVPRLCHAILLPMPKQVVRNILGMFRLPRNLVGWQEVRFLLHGLHPVNDH